MDRTPDQEAEAQRLFALLQPPFLDEARPRARLRAAQPDNKLLGQTEFEVRDAVHRLGARALQAALDERNQGATRGPAGTAPTAGPMPAARVSAGVPP